MVVVTLARWLQSCVAGNNEPKFTILERGNVLLPQGV